MIATLLVLTAGLSAGSLPEPDSVALRRAAGEAQARLERIRTQLLPSRWGGGNRCDERIGRMCWTHGGDEDWYPPPDPERLTVARDSLLSLLASTAREIPGDAWVAGQRVRYLGETGRWTEAMEVARECIRARGEDGPPVPATERGNLASGHCHDLLGYALHRTGDALAAELAFRRALAWMHGSRVELRTDPRVVADIAAHRILSPGLPPEELERIRTRFWRLGDPLWLVPGNDRWTEHQARYVAAAIREDSRNPHAIPWGSDLTEVLVRFGESIGWERTRESLGAFNAGSVVGHGPNGARSYLPPGPFLAEPVTIQDGEWDLNPRFPRAIHTPPYASRIGHLPVQVARFPRPDGAVVVAGFRHPEAGGDEGGAGATAGTITSVSAPETALPAAGSPLRDPGGHPIEQPRSRHPPVEAGLFLVQPDGDRMLQQLVAGAESRGLYLEAPTGDYLLGVELLDRVAERAWRARFGLRIPAFIPDLAGLSDLLLVEADHPEFSDPADAVSSVLPGADVESGGAVGVLWETYGAGEGETVAFEASLVPADRGTLRRAAEWLRIVGRAAATQVASPTARSSSASTTTCGGATCSSSRAPPPPATTSSSCCC
jgi:hypothetical protein